MKLEETRSSHLKIRMERPVVYIHSPILGTRQRLLFTFKGAGAPVGDEPLPYGIKGDNGAETS